MDYITTALSSVGMLEGPAGQEGIGLFRREERTEETKGSFPWEVISEKELLGWARGWVKDAVDRGYAMFG